MILEGVSLDEYFCITFSSPPLLVFTFLFDAAAAAEVDRVSAAFRAAHAEHGPLAVLVGAALAGAPEVVVLAEVLPPVRSVVEEVHVTACIFRAIRGVMGAFHYIFFSTLQACTGSN